MKQNHKTGAKTAMTVAALLVSVTLAGAAMAEKTEGAVWD